MLKGRKKFQSTLPYGSDVCPLIGREVGQTISIHAPLRERLPPKPCSYRSKGISIHAPLRERRLSPHGSSCDRDFNPRSLTGATPWNSMITKIPANFNPRSLTGATILLVQTIPYRINFNPRSLTGATNRTVTKMRTQTSFQSTLPYGSDIINDFVQSNEPYFNPRSLTGATARDRRCEGNGLFQSTLPYGSDAF